MAHDRVPGRAFHNLLRGGSLPFWVLVGLGGGVAGVLVDADHIPDWILDARSDFYPLNVLGFHHSRHLHSVLFLVGLCGLACAGGQALILVLRENTKK